MSTPRTLDPSLPLSLRRKLAGVVGRDHLIDDPDRLLVYESDALTQYRHAPSAVVLPGSEGELAEVIRILHLEGRPLVPRGAGTGLSGGALALDGAVVVGTARLNRILEVDPGNRRARVEPGVINAALTRATLPHGLIYAPDPSSQSACTLGGNVAENSGGPHCLKYGVTSRYVTGLTVLLFDGRKCVLESADRGWEGPDWLGLFVGSEGCLGVVSQIEVALVPVAEGVRTLLGIFDSLEDAGGAVTRIMGRGLLPAALEIVDRETIRAVEASIFAAGYPVEAGAALVVELDGVEAGLDEEAALAEACCREAGATEVRVARSDAERTALWAGRKKAFGAMGRIAPDLLVQDATVPRSRLPEVLARIGEIGRRHRLTVANVFHAGDGNLHPNLLFDRSDADELARVEAASREIMATCIEVGGTITGEHGVGLDKRDYMEKVLSPAVLHAMAGVRAALDPGRLLNPGKVLPDRLPPLPPLPADPDGSPETGSVEVTSEDHAAALLARASRQSVPVRIGDPRRLGALPDRHLHLVTDRLVGVRDHSPADLTVEVGAGTTLEALREALREAGQWFPLDPPGGASTTLGAALARGVSGPLSAGYGRLRDHLLGATLVTGEGRILALGGRVVKNVAGFDLLRLAVGSRGGMGLVTRMTLRLFPLPAVDRSLFWDGLPPVEGAALGRRLAQTGLPVAALEWGWGLPEAPGGRVAARLHGSRAAVDAMAAGLRSVGGDPSGILDGGSSAAWWEARAREEGAGRLRVRIPTRPDRAEAVAERTRAAREAGGRMSLHLLSGGLRLSLESGAGEAEEQAVRATLPGLREAGGVVPRQEEAFPEALRVFDPRGILAGRWREGWL